MNNSTTLTTANGAVNWDNVEAAFIAGIEGQVTGHAMTQDAIKLYLNAGKDGEARFLKAAFASVQRASEQGEDAARKRGMCIRKNIGEATDKAATIKKVYGGNGKRGNPHIGYKLDVRAVRETVEATQTEQAIKGIKHLNGLSSSEIASVLATLDSDTLATIAEMVRNADAINGEAGE